MNEKNDDLEMKELVLKTLLIEVYKDGQVEQSEISLINDLGSALNVSRERFTKIIEQLPLGAVGLNSSIPRDPAGYVEMFVAVRAKLVEYYPAERTDQYLAKLAACLGRESEFADSLSVGF